MYSSVINFNPDEIHNVSRRYGWQCNHYQHMKVETQLKHLQKYGWQCNHHQHIKNQNEIETLSEVWLTMQSLPTHLAEIKWTNSPVPLA